MNTTILASFVLSGALAAAKPEFSAHTDYGQAMQQAVTQQKPMAVLIGKGDQFAKLMADTGMPEETAKLLREKYVCMTVDVNTSEGAKLANQFQMQEGLVISSAGGSHQALRQGGPVTATDLAKHIPTYANGPSIPANTTTLGSAPVIASTPYIYPTYSYPTYSPLTYSQPIYPATYAYPPTQFYTPSYCIGGS